MTCGIYCITNRINGKQYVGQSINIENRFKQHIESNTCSEIHNAIVEYGVANFKFEIIVECSEQELDEQEVKFIRLLDSYANGYNQTLGGQHRVFNVEYDYKTLSEMEQELKDKKTIIKSLKQKNNHLEQRIIKIENELIELRNEKEYLKTKNIRLEKEFKQYKKEAIKPLQSRIKYLEKGEFTRFKKENKKLHSENKRLRFENEMLRTASNTKNSEEISKNNIFYDVYLEKKGAIK